MHLQQIIKNDVYMTRIKQHLSQRNLATYVGIGHHALLLIEKHRTRPSLEVAAKLCIQLKVEPEDLFELDFEPLHQEIKKLKS